MIPEVTLESSRTQAQELKLGMTLLGLTFSSILFGITLTQAYSYYRKFPRDTRTIKSMVVAMTAMDTVSAFLITHATWFYLVTTGSLKVSVWSLNAELVLSMMISGLAEMFLIYRVWMLSRNYILSLILVALALLHFGIGEVSAIQFFQLKYFSKFAAVKVPSVLRLTSGALCDTGIAISLCYFLQKKRTGYRRTDRIIDHLMMFAINSGLVTSVSSICCLVTYLLVPTTWAYIALCFLISRLYANTFLSSLNSRQILNEYGNGSDDRISPIHPIFDHDRIASGANESPKATAGHIDILVSREVISRIDSTSRSDATSSSPRSSEGKEKTSEPA